MQLKTVRLVMSGDLNSYGTLFGGKLMCWMDELAAILSMRLTCRECVTAKFSNVQFVKSAKLGDMLELEATLKERHKTSLEIEITVKKSDSSHKWEKMGSAVATFVALDEDKKPTDIWKTNCHI